MARKWRLFFDRLHSLLKPRLKPLLKGNQSWLLLACVTALLTIALPSIATLPVPLFTLAQAPAAPPAGDALDQAALQHYNQGDPTTALSQWRQAEIAYRQADNQDGSLRSRINQAQALQAMGNYRSALALLSTLQAELKDAPASLAKVVVLRSLGNTIRVAGDSNESLERTLERSQDALNESLSLVTANPAFADERPKIHLSLGNVARSQLKLNADRGKPAAQTIQELVASNPLTATTIDDQLTIYTNLFASAFTHYQAAANATAASDRTQAQLNYLSMLLDASQPLVEGLRWVDQRLQARSQPDAPVRLLRSRLATQATLFLVQAEALQSELQTQVPSLVARIGITARINLAKSLRRYDVDRVADATQRQEKTLPPSLLPRLTTSDTAIVTLLTDAVQLAKQSGDRRAEAEALGILGQINAQKASLADAERQVREGLRTAYAAQAIDLVGPLQGQLADLLDQQGNLEEAAIASNAAVTTVNSQRGDVAGLSPDVQGNLRDTVEPLYRRAVERNLRLAQTATTPNARTAALEIARQQIENLQLTQLDNFFRAACLEGRRVALDQLTDDPRNQSTVILYPIILPNQLHVLVKLPGQALKLSAPLNVSQSVIEKTLQRLYSNAGNTDTGLRPDLREPFEQVYQWLIKPIEPDLDALKERPTLVFVLDGAFRNVPMAALYDGKQYLVQKYAVSVNLGLQLLDPTPLAKERLTVLAGGLSTKSANFDPLPNIKGEFEQITQAVGSPAIRILLDENFTASNLQAEINLQPFNVVHLATHGTFASQRENTFIVTAPDPQGNDRLGFNDLSRLLNSRDRKRPEPIELLVLSACKTADGDSRSTLGLAGLALQSGARSTVGALWNVPDDSTTTLIGRFYQELVKPGVTKAEALRRAQAMLIAAGKPPLDWAAFILLGNWL